MSFRLSHLALLLAITTLLAAIAGVATTLWVADREFGEVLADDLEHQSNLLAELLATGNVELSATALEEMLIDVFEEDDEETLWVTVYDTSNNRQISNLAHDLPLDSARDGSVERQLLGYDWHGYQEHEDNIVVQILRRADRNKDIREEILEDIITPVLAGSVVNILLLAVLIVLTLGPLTKLARELESRSPDSLDPVTIKTPAREIIVLRDSLNELIRGIDSVVTRERQFASDVAHELRTPLTTLKIELASAEPDMPSLKAEVDRLTRLVEQLLTLARLDSGKWHNQFTRLSMSDLVSRVVSRFEERFHGAGMVLQTDLTPAIVNGDATLLEILLHNLLVNVLNHCPSGTVADIELAKADDHVRIRFSDNGPGIAEDTRRQMSGGFTRLDSRSDGFGIGLAICLRIAEVHGGVIRFTEREDGSSGLVVEIRLPA